MHISQLDKSLAEELLDLHFIVKSASRETILKLMKKYGYMSNHSKVARFISTTSDLSKGSMIVVFENGESKVITSKNDDKITKIIVKNGNNQIKFETYFLHKELTN